VFTTSNVTEIGDNYFKTRNSVYSYKLLWGLLRLHNYRMDRGVNMR
jgi:hypothetical protein